MKNPYLRYLWYVIRHKWYVSIACFKVGLYWRGITHDMSKLRPSEFFPYAKFFYGSSYNQHEFDFAWLLHQKRNKHHWQWWILREDDGGTKVFQMDLESVEEMVCDWIGAGRAINGKNDCVEWYRANRHKMQLNPRDVTYLDAKLYFN